MDKSYITNKRLDAFCRTVANAVSLIDTEMKKPSTEGRGKLIAKILNRVELDNDSIMHFGLGYGFDKINKIKSA